MIWGNGWTLVALAMVSLLLVWAVPVSAATGPLYAAGHLTLSEGVVFIPGHQGGHVWEGDHGLDVCRLDLTPAGNAAPVQSNQITYNTAVSSPGQMAFAQDAVYVPDNTVRSQEGGCLTFDPATETVDSLVLLAHGAGRTWGNPDAVVALRPDSTLYRVLRRNRKILRSTKLDGLTQLVESVDLVPDRQGSLVLAVPGHDWYLAAAHGITVMPNAPACSSRIPCTVAPAADLSVALPTFISAAIHDGSCILYIRATSNVYRLTFPSRCPTSMQHILATVGTTAGSGTTVCSDLTVLRLKADGPLDVGGDPRAGVFMLTGRVLSVPFTLATYGEATRPAGWPPQSTRWWRGGG